MQYTVSVVMATYNGGKYVNAQIESILSQLSESDELIISDDGSTDGTLDIINHYAKINKNVVVYEGPHKGYIENFQFLLSKTKKDLVMISDQDDIWKCDKIKKVKQAFADNIQAWLVVHDASFINDEGKALEGTIFAERKAKQGFWKNWLKSMYYGCCMTLKKEYVDFITPFPYTVAAYDQWIGLFAELKKKSVMLNEQLINHRIHNNNQSVKRSFSYRIWFRYEIIRYVVALKHREMGKI